jgi:flagellar hook-length control protein FliK
VSMWVTGSAANGPMTAELHLNPAEMGPIHIRIELDGTQAQVDFAAAQSDTRQAIEASMSHLSGALESAGLSLSGGGVSDQGARQAWSGEQGQGQGQGSRTSGWTPEGSRDATRALDGLAPMNRTSVSSSGLAGGLDLYA